MATCQPRTRPGRTANSCAPSVGSLVSTALRGAVDAGESVVEQVLAGGPGEQVGEHRDQPGPAGLVAGGRPGAVVTVEVLGECHEVPPVLVVGEDRLPAVAGTVPALGRKEDPHEAVGDLPSDLVEGHVPARAGGAF